MHVGLGRCLSLQRGQKVSLARTLCPASLCIFKVFCSLFPSFGLLSLLSCSLPFLRFSLDTLGYLSSKGQLPSRDFHIVHRWFNNLASQVIDSLVLLWWHGIYIVLLLMWLSEYSIITGCGPRRKMANRCSLSCWFFSSPVRDSPQMLKSRSLLNCGTSLTSLEYSLLCGQSCSANPFLSFAGQVKYLHCTKMCRTCYA